MDGDDAGPPLNSPDVNDQSFSVKASSFREQNVDNQDACEIEEDVDNEDEDGDDDLYNNDVGEDDVQQVEKNDFDDCVGDDDEDDEQDELQSHPKKRKLKNVLSGYEFVRRIPAQSSVAASAPKPSYGGRNPLTDWTEHETLILLDAWGERFLSQSRKSLRSEEWHEVAEKVSQESKIERTDTQCRNRLDTLKKRYKKEKTKLEETGQSSSNWICFKKMDMLLTSNPPQTANARGVELAESGFSDRKDYLNCSKGLDVLKNSPGNSESSEDEQDAEDLPPKKTKSKRVRGIGASFKLLADSILKFVEIYEKIENNKRSQMLELEKMRMDFHRDLELQKMQIQAEMIAKIRKSHDEDNDASAENING